MTRRKKCLIMCRTGMGSSMMLKIKVEKLIDKNVDLIITMEYLIDEFKNSPAYVIGVKDIMDTEYLQQELDKYFAQTE